jgi:hypothetical protein
MKTFFIFLTLLFSTGVFAQEEWFLAAQNDDLPTIQKMLGEGTLIDGVNDEEQTALIVACRYRSEKVVQFLCQVGAKVDAADMYGQTGLMYAVNSYSHRDYLPDAFANGADLVACGCKRKR